MTTKQIISILLIIYILAIIGLTIFHAFNFSDYIHVKGDETIYYTLFLLITSILFQTLISLVTRTIDWKTTPLATIVNFIISFIAGFGILMITGLSGIPKHLIFIYGGCYMTIFSVVTIIQIRRLTTDVEQKFTAPNNNHKQ